MTEITDTSNLGIFQRRYHYYWIARNWQDQGNLSKTIEAYKEYATHLAKKDQHIPHQWISRFYEKLDKPKESLYHLELFAEGCASPRAANEYKTIGERYLSINAKEKAILNFEKAIKINPQIGVKTILKNLKKN